MRSHITLGSILNCFSLPVFLLAQAILITINAQGVASTGNSHSAGAKLPAPRTASERLSASLNCFFPIDDDANYSITICADLPDNANPDRVHVKTETGHVFIILSKWNEKDSIHSVFGFYPRRPASSLVFKNVRAEILNNGNREYNASLSRRLNKDSFRLAINTAIELAKKKYNINKYNCYDYAIGIFNSVAGENRIPIHHIRFPFIFGKGGSPCSLYADLKEIQRSRAGWAPSIQFGLFRAPVSTQ